MKLVQANEIDQLISITPDTQDNQMLLSALDALRADLKVVKEPYSYVAAYATLAAGAVVTNNIAIDASAIFVVCNTTYSANLAGAAQTASTMVIPNVSVMLTDGGAGRPLMSANVGLTELFGSAAFPYVWPEPLLLAPNSVLQVAVTSLEAASTPNLRLTFNGYKLKSLG
jgi:hypothetical protein